jgi:hypothetical protein
MIKKFGIMLMMAVTLIAGFGIDKASAGWSGVGACGVQIYTDATTYSTSATTVDWKAQKPSTQCGTVYYKMRILQVGDGTADIGYQTSGYFSSATPLKYVSISTIKSMTPYPQPGAETYRIELQLYSSSSYTTRVGEVYSSLFYIY